MGTPEVRSLTPTYSDTFPRPKSVTLGRGKVSLKKGHPASKPHRKIHAALAPIFNAVRARAYVITSLSRQWPGNQDRKGL